MKVKILSSHIIRSNKHRDQIKSAITDPINKELIQQLSEYIDWDDVDEEVIDELKGEDSKEDVSEEEVSEDETSEDEINDEDKPDKPDKPEKDKAEEPEKPEKPELDSATHIPSNKIESAIKTTLTQLQSSKDINLISIKGNEIWVRYNDTINLNDIMYDTIKCVTDNTDLTFNRLARFDNSIVFIQ